MNKYKVATMICWIITALVLVGLVVWFLTGAVFGAGMRGFQGVNFINFGIGRFENLAGPFEPFDEVGRYEISQSGLDTIEISWIAGEVTVIPHDGDEIIVTEYAQRDLRNNEQFFVRAYGGTLRINYVERGFRNINILKRLQVLVPHELSANMRELYINSASGLITVDDITADILNLNSTSGAVEVSGAFQRADLGSVSGAIRMVNAAENSRVDVSNVSGATTISGFFDRVDVSSISGSVAMRSEAMPASTDISTVSGSITIALPSDGESISVNHTSVSGRLTSDIPHTTTSGRAQIDVSTVSGSTRIEAISD